MHKRQIVPETLISLVVAVVACGFLTSASAQQPGELTPSSVLSDEVELASQVELIIPTDNGKLVWKDVASSLAESLKLDASTVQRWFPTGKLDLHSNATALALFGIDSALGDAISIAMVRDEDGDPALRLRCDRNAIGFLASKHEPEAAAIDLDDDWIDRSKRRPVVICLHGLKSESSKFDDFRAFLRKSGYATAAVRYDDHQSIIQSAQQLSQITAEVFGVENLDGANAPELVLVGHSMGGLVAREWTENPALSNKHIVALITAGTPHGGSAWASLPPLLDLLAERKLDSSQIVDVLLHQPSAPGMRELAPESRFLNMLNSRTRRADVQYTTFVGTRSPVSTERVRKLRETLLRIKDKSTTLRLFEPRIRPLLNSFDELARGKGDGVVAAERATIIGIEDVVRVDVSHGAYFQPPIGDRKQPVWEAILQRLENG